MIFIKFEDKKTVMKILFISDTHGQHRKLKNLPQADMLIHAGDISQRGEDHEVEGFIKMVLQVRLPIQDIYSWQS